MPQPIRRATLIAALASAALTAAAQDGDIAAGHSFAREACSACHVVDAQQHRLPWRIFIAPAFGTIANTPGKTATALPDVLATSHPKLPDPILTPEQMADVIAYILSLRSDPAPESKRSTADGRSSGLGVSAIGR
jgi:mono/diheme cytochrome c family protein